MLSIFTRPAPPPAGDPAWGLPRPASSDSPQLQASTSISPLCLASEDSPSIPASLRNISNGMMSPPSPDPDASRRAQLNDTILRARSPAPHVPRTASFRGWRIHDRRSKRSQPCSEGQRIAARRSRERTARAGTGGHHEPADARLPGGGDGEASRGPARRGRADVPPGPALAAGSAGRVPPARAIGGPGQPAGRRTAAVRAGDRAQSRRARIPRELRQRADDRGADRRRGGGVRKGYFATAGFSRGVDEPGHGTAQPRRPG